MAGIGSVWLAAALSFGVPADKVIRIRRTRRGVDMIDLMHELAKREIMTILIEGGGTTHATAFKSGVVDKIMFFVAPKIIGGRDAVRDRSFNARRDLRQGRSTVWCRELYPLILRRIVRRCEI